MSAIINTYAEAWVELYRHKDFAGTRIRIPFGENIPNLDDRDFGDETSSVRWQIPPGWQCVLYDDAGYEDRSLPLIGNGHVMSFSNLDRFSFGDKTSSIRWSQV